MNHRNVFQILLSTILLIIVSCSSDSKMNDEVITIDVLKAIDNPKPFKLSEIVDSVEIITLESNEESYFGQGSDTYIGEQYILVCISSSSMDKVLLFNRSGKFIRKIGRQGKGPGEYLSVYSTVINEEAGIIIIVDFNGKKFLKYSLNGDFIMEKSYDRDTPGRFLRNLYFVDNQHFALSVQSPRITVRDFAKVLLYNTDFQIIKEVLPIKQKEDQAFNGPISNVFYPIDEGFLFWAGSKDTIFYLGSDFIPKAKYNLYISSASQDKNFFKSVNKDSRNRTYDYNEVLEVHDLPNYLLARVYKKSDECFIIVHNKDSKESFSVKSHKDCITEKNYWPSIENDLFGVEPIIIGRYNPQLNLFFTTFTDNSLYKIDYDCVLEKDVKMPAIRDSIVKKMQNHPTSEENSILVIMHLKSKIQ